jgi:YD repeat-containing protein
MSRLSPFRLLRPLVLLLLCSQSLLADTPVAGRTYVYDADGRLIQEVISDGSKTVTVTYTYDQAGNLLEVKPQ